MSRAKSRRVIVGNAALLCDPLGGATALLIAVCDVMAGRCDRS